MWEPERNACRRMDGRFPDGQQQFIWTLANGEGLFHDHSEGRCPFGPGGHEAGRAEQVAGGLTDRACVCCGEAVPH